MVASREHTVKIDTKNMISVTELSKNVSPIIRSASEGNVLTVLTNNKPVAVIMGMESAERLSRIDEIEDDIRLLLVALGRSVADNGNRHSLDDVAAELGIDIAELNKD